MIKRKQNFSKLLRSGLRSRFKNQLNCLSFYKQEHEDVNNQNDKRILNFTELTNRKVIKVSGKDAFSYIQLMTSNNLQQNLNCLNSYMTTPNSKILCDLLIYKIKGDVFDKELVLNGLTSENYGKRIVDCLEENENLKETNQDLIDELKQFSKKDEEEILYLECDAKLADSIRKTLFVRKLGQNVNFQILNDYQIYSIYPSIDENMNGQFILDDEFISNYFCFVNDPRLAYLGQRIISRIPIEALEKFLDLIFKEKVHLNQKSLKEYKLHRYKLGVGEGLDEHLMAKTLLNSFNADFLNGVNLYKGGFSGLKPVERIITRKYKYMRRLLPFEFINPSNRKLANLPTSTNFLSLKDGQPIGELISNVNNYGIGYFKLQPFIHIDHNRSIKTKLNYNQNELEALVKIPFWWPELRNLKFLTYEDGLNELKEQLLSANELSNDEFQLEDH